MIDITLCDFLIQDISCIHDTNYNIDISKIIVLFFSTYGGLLILSKLVFYVLLPQKQNYIIC